MFRGLNPAPEGLHVGIDGPRLPKGPAAERRVEQEQIHLQGLWSMLSPVFCRSASQGPDSCVKQRRTNHTNSVRMVSSTVLNTAPSWPVTRPRHCG